MKRAHIRRSWTIYTLARARVKWLFAFAYEQNCTINEWAHARFKRSSSMEMSLRTWNRMHSVNIMNRSVVRARICLGLDHWLWWLLMVCTIPFLWMLLTFFICIDICFFGFVRINFSFENGKNFHRTGKMKRRSLKFYWYLGLYVALVLILWFNFNGAVEMNIMSFSSSAAAFFILQWNRTTTEKWTDCARFTRFMRFNTHTHRIFRSSS